MNISSEIISCRRVVKISSELAYLLKGTIFFYSDMFCLLRSVVLDVAETQAENFKQTRYESRNEGRGFV